MDKALVLEETGQKKAGYQSHLKPSLS